MTATGTSAGRRRVYVFGAGHSDGNAGMIAELGGKGANLAEMASLGLPVPPGFTIAAAVCREYFANGNKVPADLEPEVAAALEKIGAVAGKRFGDPADPLLVAVRSGARASMPGMMDTILNLGLNDETVKGLATVSGDERFAYDSYRRFIQMYADVVMGIGHDTFEAILENYRNLQGFFSDPELGPDDWRQIIAEYKETIEVTCGAAFPQDTHEQLMRAIGAVFGSWQSARAITYRRLHDIPDDWGTAVNVQAMVFGNRGDTSATGVGFTRNPSTGGNEIYGEFLPNAQGEDVVAGFRTPQPLTERMRQDTGTSMSSLEADMPGAYAELQALFRTLERHYADMQDVEFTIEEGRLWVLQTRSGKRSVEASLRIAVELANEGLITREEAVMRIDPAALVQLLHPTIAPDAKRVVLTQGLPASPGAAAGEIVFTAEEAEKLKAKGRDVILVRAETSPEDIHGMHAAVGILTARGGMTSHAAVVARGMGRPCVCGAGMLRIDAKAGTMTAGREALKAGDIITIDGSTGQVLKGRAAMRQPELSGNFGTLMSWADGIRRLGVRANVDTARDAAQAIDYGAEGIGLCRTEHMFFDEERILAMREAILARDEAGRRAAFAKIQLMQRADFERLFEVMEGRPVTIRLLDPPLHEFLPREDKELDQLAAALNMPRERILARMDELDEYNPMLGFRGCRLGILYPEITEMQARAVLEAAVRAGRKLQKPVVPEIMVPLVVWRREFDLVAAIIARTASAISKEMGAEVVYELGTMIETPRACLMAEDIARGKDGAAFFSFGTNDLTQMALGLSRDDAAPILSAYSQRHVFEVDPFVAVDFEGVGELVRIGVERGRRTRADLKVGICGEHGGEPKSVAFFHEAGLDYVSCSPYRVPVARLAAAQAAILGRPRTSKTD